MTLLTIRDAQIETDGRAGAGRPQICGCCARYEVDHIGAAASGYCLDLVAARPHFAFPPQMFACRRHQPGLPALRPGRPELEFADGVGPAAAAGHSCGDCAHGRRPDPNLGAVDCAAAKAKGVVAYTTQSFRACRHWMAAASESRPAASESRPAGSESRPTGRGGAAPPRPSGAKGLRPLDPSGLSRGRPPSPGSRVSGSPLTP